MCDNELNPVVGIDLGTTFSCIARWAGDRSEPYKLADGSDTLPSIVYLQESGKPLVGKYARQKLIIDPPNTVQHIKRYIGDDNKVVTLREKKYTPVDISAMILGRLKEDVQKMFPASAGFEFAGVIVTHPQYFKYPQIARTQEAAEQAELPVIRLLAEPVAAALDYGFTAFKGLEEERQEKILVFDLGGGTFDVTVLEVLNDPNTTTFRVLAVGGDAMLGGTNFDDAFVQWALEEGGIHLGSLDDVTRDRTMAKLVEAVIEAKIQLSSLEDTYLAVPNILPGQHLELEVSRQDFNQIIDRFCKQIRNIVSNTLVAANVRGGELDRTILIGGSSRIPIMRDIVQEETGAEPWANTDPDLAVCRGAAFLAAMDAGRVATRKEVVIEEATSHALGIRAAGGAFSILIPANRRAPVKAKKQYRINASDFQVVPYQGRGKKVSDDGVIQLKPIDIQGVELGPDGWATVEVTFTVNEQQLLFVEVKAPGVHEQRQMEF